MPDVLGSIVTDCADKDARTRQELRFNSLFGSMPSFVGVESYSPLEAAGNLIDQLDVLANLPLAETKRDIVVLFNVAPRGGDVKQKWDNGTPFCYFNVGRILVVGTYNEVCLALLRDMGIAHEVHIMDIPTVTASAVEWGELTGEQAERINDTQFRSLEFMPLAAYWLRQGKAVPAVVQSLDGLEGVPSTGKVWFVDNFGNLKTTLRAKDVGFKEGQELTLSNGQLVTCYRRLADVPKDTTGLTIGSSGYGQDRFLEVVVGERGRATDVHGLTISSQVLATV